MTTTDPDTDHDAQQRRAQALELHRAGLRDADIAARLGYGGAADAHQDVQRALAGVTDAPAAGVITGEVDRLDALLAGLWPKARRGDIPAIDRVLRIMDRRARYLGLTRKLPNRGPDPDTDAP